MKTRLAFTIALLLSLFSASAQCVNITAKDFVTKVYGICSPDRSKSELCDDCANALNLTPSEDNMGLWLDSADGYQLNYYGIVLTDVSAMATVESDSVSNFGYFFLFPYTSATKEEISDKQASFCGCLLQEMQDIGAMMGVNTVCDCLYEACGEYQGNFVDVRLSDETTDEGNGRYVLYLLVEPAGFKPVDNMAAL